MGKYGFSLKKTPPGVYPLLAVVGAAIGGAGYFCFHTIRNPENVFSRSGNPQPWQTVKPYQTTKLYNPTGYFKESWSRERDNV
jgi:NADH dehydrogenase (ubiquinone) 1 alpha subcomplex subunit 4